VNKSVENTAIHLKGEELRRINLAASFIRLLLLKHLLTSIPVKQVVIFILYVASLSQLTK
jgi:hypothetical protein